MNFKQCSIHGKKYKVLNIGIQEEDKPNVLRLPQYNSDVKRFFEALAICHTVQVAHSIQKEDYSELEESFEIIDSNPSLVELDEEDISRKEETRNNTKFNKNSVPENQLNNLQSESECKIFFAISI